MSVLSVSRVFDLTKGPKRGPKAPRVVDVSLSGQRSLVLRPKALNVGAEGLQCLGRRPSVSRAEGPPG